MRQLTDFDLRDIFDLSKIENIRQILLKFEGLDLKEGHVSGWVLNANPDCLLIR